MWQWTNVPVEEELQEWIPPTEALLRVPSHNGYEMAIAPGLLLPGQATHLNFHGQLEASGFVVVAHQQILAGQREVVPGLAA